MGDYVYEIIRQLKLVGKKDMDSRSVAQRNALKAELKRLGYTASGRKKLMPKKLFVFLLTISLIINIYWGWYFYPSWFPHSVNIPNEHQIDNFCKSNNFDYGWLSSSSCRENQVQCSRKIFDAIQYKCLDWNILSNKTKED